MVDIGTGTGELEPGHFAVSGGLLSRSSTFREKHLSAKPRREESVEFAILLRVRLKSG